MLLCANKRTLCAALGIPAVWFFRAPDRSGRVQRSGGGHAERASAIRPCKAGARHMDGVFSRGAFAAGGKSVGHPERRAAVVVCLDGRDSAVCKAPLSRDGRIQAYSHLEDNHPKLAHGLRPAITAVCCSIASSAFSLPICAYYFKLMSVSGLLTNALCLWLVSGIFSAGLVTAIAACVWSPIGIGLGGFLRGRRGWCSGWSAAWRAPPPARFLWKPICRGLDGVFLLRGLADLSEI